MNRCGLGVRRGPLAGLVTARPTSDSCDVMQCVHMAKTVAEAHIVKGILESEGITCEIRGEHLSSAIGGGLPPHEAWPSVWVRDDDAVRADELVVGVFRAKADEEGDWECPACGEQLEGQFTECWQCGTSRP